MAISLILYSNNKKNSYFIISLNKESKILIQYNTQSNCSMLTKMLVSIHNSERFNKSHKDPIEDFLMGLCSEKTVYGHEIDYLFPCKTTERRRNGWPEEPENINHT